MKQGVEGMEVLMVVMKGAVLVKPWRGRGCVGVGSKAEGVIESEIGLETLKVKVHYKIIYISIVLYILYFLYRIVFLFFVLYSFVFFVLYSFVFFYCI